MATTRCRSRSSPPTSGRSTMWRPSRCAAAGFSSPATQRTAIRRPTDLAPTPRSRTASTWRGSWPPCCAVTLATHCSTATATSASQWCAAWWTAPCSPCATCSPFPTRSASSPASPNRKAGPTWTNSSATAPAAASAARRCAVRWRCRTTSSTPTAWNWGRYTPPAPSLAMASRNPPPSATPSSTTNPRPFQAPRCRTLGSRPTVRAFRRWTWWAGAASRC
ncbi:hypothetical protein D3C86_1475770 [compost metagenome]